MATIYYWAASQERARVGHLSLGLDDGTYISHWPADKSKQMSGKKNGMGHHTLEEDVEAEGGEPSEIVKVPAEMINIVKIKEWWNSMMEEGTNYHLVGDNCAQMVLTALKEGDMNLTWSLYDPSEHIVLVTPFSVLDWIKKCLPGHQSSFLDRLQSVMLHPLQAPRANRYTTGLGYWFTGVFKKN